MLLKITIGIIIHTVLTELLHCRCPIVYLQFKHTDGTPQSDRPSCSPAGRCPNSRYSPSCALCPSLPVPRSTRRYQHSPSAPGPVRCSQHVRYHWRAASGQRGSSSAALRQAAALAPPENRKGRPARFPEPRRRPGGQLDRTRPSHTRSSRARRFNRGRHRCQT